MNKLLTIAVSGLFAGALVANTATTAKPATPKETSAEATQTNDVDVSNNPITGSKTVTTTTEKMNKKDGMKMKMTKKNKMKYDSTGKKIEDSTEVKNTNN